MIKYTDQNAVKNQLFRTPFQNELDIKNRWVMLAENMPWDKMATIYIDYMSQGMGRSTVDLRTVMGAMFIQHALNLTDRNTIEMISENIYMQYFVGLSSFQSTPIFDHSLLSVFRQRLGKKGAEQLNEITISHAFESGQIKHRKSRNPSKIDDNSSKNQDNKNEDGTDKPREVDQDNVTKNRGTVKIDATVVPQNITYPTDAKLLNHSRELSEAIIDELYEQLREGWRTKPRTYRREARKKWLQFSKNRKPNNKRIRKIVKTQLGYLNRNLKHIDNMLSAILQSGERIVLTERLRKKMYVIGEIYRQQRVMHDDRRKRISDRIVNVSQPWVRPIVRGKAGSAVEFGAKINLSLTEQLVTVDYSSFDAFNEGSGFVDQLKGYKERFGYYPEYALADKIYLTRHNRKFMKDNDIKHTGSPLGRPKARDKQLASKMKKKNNQRNHIEGKIGQGKQKFGLDQLRTKTVASSLCAINFIVLTMNMLALMEKKVLNNFDWLRVMTVPHIKYLNLDLIANLKYILKPLNSNPNVYCIS